MAENETNDGFSFDALLAAVAGVDQAEEEQSEEGAKENTKEEAQLDGPLDLAAMLGYKGEKPTAEEPLCEKGDVLAEPGGSPEENSQVPPAAQEQPLENRLEPKAVPASATVSAEKPSFRSRYADVPVRSSKPSVGNAAEIARFAVPKIVIRPEARRDDPSQAIHKTTDPIPKTEETTEQIPYEERSSDKEQIPAEKTEAYLIGRNSDDETPVESEIQTLDQDENEENQEPEVQEALAPRRYRSRILAGIGLIVAAIMIFVGSAVMHAMVSDVAVSEPAPEEEVVVFTSSGIAATYSYTTYDSDGNPCPTVETASFDADGILQQSAIVVSTADPDAAKATLSEIQNLYGKTYIGGKTNENVASFVLKLDDMQLSKDGYTDLLKSGAKNLTIIE